MRKVIDHPVDALLPEWARWVRRENDASLGYSQVKYTEYVSRSTSASEYVGDFDPRIRTLDRLIRQHLAYTPRRMLELRFVHGLPDKTAGSVLSLSRSEFSRMLHVIVLPQLRFAWEEHGDVRTI